MNTQPLLPVQVLRKTGAAVISIIEGTGLFFVHVFSFSVLTVKAFLRLPLILKNIRISIEQMYVIGLESMSLVAVTSVFVGGEAVIQCIYQFSGLVPLRYLGMAVCKTLITELCPVITSLVVCSRISTAIAAEIGSMKSSEQLDAMECLSLDPVRYLVVPKVVAAVIMMPVLVIFSELIAFSSSILTAVLFTKVTFHLYVTGLRMFFFPNDLLFGIIKTATFGMVISLTGAHFGFQAKKGAEGVGEATTKAVMTAMVLILILDFVIAFLLL